MQLKANVTSGNPVGLSLYVVQTESAVRRYGHDCRILN